MSDPRHRRESRLRARRADRDAGARRACASIASRRKRVNDLSPFGPTVMASQGVGTTVEEFERGVADGTIVGHIGFPESIHLIAKAFGLDDRRDRRDARADRDERAARDAARTGGAGRCVRLPSRRQGLRRRRAQDRARSPAADPPGHARAWTPATTSRSSAIRRSTWRNTPEIPGGKGTYASTGNYIRLIGDAPPGIQTVVDMPLPRFWAPTVVGGATMCPRDCDVDEWVEIECVLLEARRSARRTCPEDTAEQPLKMWVKGFAPSAQRRRARARDRDDDRPARDRHARRRSTQATRTRFGRHPTRSSRTSVAICGRGSPRIAPSQVPEAGEPR